VSAGCRREHGRLVNEDAELLKQLAPLSRPLEVINPVALEPAVAPHIAAAEAGLRLEADALAKACRSAADGAAFLVVEGAGGWRVPLTGEETLADVARGLGLPVVLVVGMRLGCLNHALLSVRAISDDGLRLAGWVANFLDPQFDQADANLAYLRQAIDAPLLATMNGEAELDMRLDPLSGAAPAAAANLPGRL